MKIICVGRNYPAHVKELGNDVPEEPVIFMKPKSALLQSHTPFYYPEFTNELNYECELVLRICKNGKYIQERHAANYYNGITVGIDFTARDIQNDLKAKGRASLAASLLSKRPILTDQVTIEFIITNKINRLRRKNTFFSFINT